MSFDFIRRMTLRRQIVLGTQMFTAVVSLLLGIVLFALSDSYIRSNTLRSVEFNLMQMATSVEAKLNNADNLRFGMRGIAKLRGERVSLGYYLFRNLVIYLRWI